MTSLPTFTVDPVSARDFDDAISAERDGDGVRLYVHIADVSAYVSPAARSTPRPASAATASTCPGQSSRCCRRRCPRMRAASCPASRGPP